MIFSNLKLKRVRPLLGTFVEIELHGRASVDQLHAWITAGFEAIAQIDQLMSPHRKDSDLSRLNRTAPRVWIKIHAHTAKVLAGGNALYQDSRGIFDIRCASKTRSFGKTPVAPVLLRGTRVCKTGPWTLDLGGIAKGYAVDCAAEVIQEIAGTGVSGIVNAGGDLRRWGPRWPAVAVATSAVRRPRSRARFTEAIHVHMPEGRPLIKPKAVSVISDRCLWSDALTKVVMMGPKSTAARCLGAYAARALLFDPSGRAHEVLG